MKKSPNMEIKITLSIQNPNRKWSRPKSWNRENASIWIRKSRQKLKSSTDWWRVWRVTASSSKTVKLINLLNTGRDCVKKYLRITTIKSWSPHLSAKRLEKLSRDLENSLKWADNLKLKNSLINYSSDTPTPPMKCWANSIKNSFSIFAFRINISKTIITSSNKKPRYNPSRNASSISMIYSPARLLPQPINSKEKKFSKKWKKIPMMLSIPRSEILPMPLQVILILKNNPTTQSHSKNANIIQTNFPMMKTIPHHSQKLKRQLQSHPRTLICHLLIRLIIWAPSISLNCTMPPDSNRNWFNKEDRWWPRTNIKNLRKFFTTQKNKKINMKDLRTSKIGRCSAVLSMSRKSMNSQCPSGLKIHMSP